MSVGKQALVLLVMFVLYVSALIAFIQFAPIALIQNARDHPRILALILLLPVAVGVPLLRRWNKE